jgi:hypothetical protein
MLRSCMQAGRSTLCFELAGAPGCDDIGASDGVAGDKPPVIDFRLLTEIDGACRRLLSRNHAGEMRFVASCERAETPAASIASVPVASVPDIYEPCGIYVSLDANRER